MTSAVMRFPGLFPRHRPIIWNVKIFSKQRNRLAEVRRVGLAHENRSHAENGTGLGRHSPVTGLIDVGVEMALYGPHVRHPIVCSTMRFNCFTSLCETVRAGIDGLFGVTGDAAMRPIRIGLAPVCRGRWPLWLRAEQVAISGPVVPVLSPDIPKTPIRLDQSIERADRATRLIGEVELGYVSRGIRGVLGVRLSIDALSRMPLRLQRRRPGQRAGEETCVLSTFCLPKERGKPGHLSGFSGHVSVRSSGHA